MSSTTKMNNNQPKTDIEACAFNPSSRRQKQTDLSQGQPSSRLVRAIMRSCLNTKQTNKPNGAYSFFLTTMCCIYF